MTKAANVALRWVFYLFRNQTGYVFFDAIWDENFCYNQPLRIGSGFSMNKLKPFCNFHIFLTACCSLRM